MLRYAARGLDSVVYPDVREDPEQYLSVMYSIPLWIVKKWMAQFDFDTVEAVCRSSHEEKGTTVRCILEKASVEEIIADLQEQNITVRRHPYLDYALEISGYNYIKAIRAFKKGWIQVQDVSSMLVARLPPPTGETTALTSVPLREEKACIFPRNCGEAVSWKPGISPSTKLS